MAVEIISRSISMKVLDLAGIELATQGSYSLTTAIQARYLNLCDYQKWYAKFSKT